MSYVGGSVTVINDSISDDVNKKDIWKMVTDLGYENVCELKYLVPGMSFEDGMRSLHSDDKFSDLVSQLVVCGEVNLFCSHGNDVGDAEIASGISEMSLLGSLDNRDGGIDAEEEVDGCKDNVGASARKALDEVSDMENVMVSMAKECQENRRRFEERKNPHIPEEIIFQILTNLPVKSLVCFKSVCKLWKFLISTPDMITCHLEQSYKTHSNTLLLLSGYSVSFALLYIDIDNGGQPTLVSLVRNSLLGCCNGILCFHSDGHSISLHNPVKYFWHTIRTRRRFVAGVVYGFGYDHLSRDYKILTSDSNQIFLFSLRSRDWKQGPTFDYTLSADQRYGKFTNGCLHWLVENGKSGESPAGNSVVAFDLHAESFSMLPLPDLKERFQDEVWSLWVFGCELCLQIDYCHSGNGTRSLDVWVMKEYGVEESWMESFRVPYEGIHIPKSMKALALSKGGSKILVEQKTKYLWYGSDGTMMMDASSVLDNFFVVDVCVGSMISLEDFQEDGVRDYQAHNREEGQL